MGSVSLLESVGGGRAGGRAGHAPAARPAGLVGTETTHTKVCENLETRGKRRRLQSQKVSLTHAGDHFQEQATKGGRAQNVAFLTLTYARVDGWLPEHIGPFLVCLREWCRRRGFLPNYAWTAELQKRGAVHYHVLVWLPKGVMLPKPDKRGWWPHGMTKIEKARKPVGYLVKYCSKGDAHQSFPKGLRLYGHSKVSDTVRRVIRWWKTPRYARESVVNQGGDMPGDMIRVPGGGFVDRCTGLAVCPRFRFFNGRYDEYVEKWWHPFYQPELEPRYRRIVVA